MMNASDGTRRQKIVLVADVREAIHKCSICSKVFITGAHLSRHITRRHTVTCGEITVSPLVHLPSRDDNGALAPPSSTNSSPIRPIEVDPLLSDASEEEVSGNLSESSTEETANEYVRIREVCEFVLDEKLMKLGVPPESEGITDSTLFSLLESRSKTATMADRDWQEARKEMESLVDWRLGRVVP